MPSHSNVEMMPDLHVWSFSRYSGRLWLHSSLTCLRITQSGMGMCSHSKTTLFHNCCSLRHMCTYYSMTTLLPLYIGFCPVRMNWECGGGQEWFCSLYHHTAVDTTDRKISNSVLGAHTWSGVDMCSTSLRTTVMEQVRNHFFPQHSLCHSVPD